MADTDLSGRADPFLASASLALSVDDQQRQQRMQLAWTAYRGLLPKPLRVELGQPDDNVLSNRCAPIVDKGVSFLFGQVLKISCAKALPHTAQQVIDEAWGSDDHRMTMLSKLATNGGVCGQAFIKIVPRANMPPRLVLLDPMSVTVITAPDDCETVMMYVITYRGIDPGTHQPAMRRQTITRFDPDCQSDGDAPDGDTTWQIAESVQRNAIWAPLGEPVIWPYPFAPIADCQNLPAANEYWGAPDLTPDLIEVNRVLNFVQSNTSRIIKYHAHPWVWARNTNASQISVQPGRIIVLPGQNSELALLEMHGDMKSSMEFAATLRSDMDEQSRVPAVALGRLADLPKGNISGVALQLLFQPLLEKTIMKQRLYGRIIRDVSARILVLAGYNATVDDIELHWQNLLPVDDLAAAQTGLALQQLGVSQETILAQLGYNANEEMDRQTAIDTKKVVALSRGQAIPPAPSVIPPIPGTPTDEATP